MKTAIPKVFVTTLLALCMGTPKPAVAVVYLPAPDFSLADSPSGTRVGLRSRYTAHASSAGDFDGQADTVVKFPSNWQESISQAGTASAVGRHGIALADWQGRTEVGRLSAMTGALVERDTGSASVSLDMQFMDVLQVDHEGVLHWNMKVTGTADEQILRAPANQAGSGITAELYVFPFGPLPEPMLPFNFTTYGKTSIDAHENTHVMPVNGLFGAGSLWWVMVQVTIHSDARGNSLLRLLPPYGVRTTANFGHTVELFITPDPSTPDASFHSASGRDYRVSAIPEPSGGLLMFAGSLLLSLIAARRRKPSSSICG